jgi:hypothetical protein
MRGVGDNAGLPVKPGVSALAQWLDDMNHVLPPAPAERTWVRSCSSAIFPSLVMRSCTSCGMSRHS